MDELVTMVTGGVPVNAAATDVDLERALQYGNHRSVIEHLENNWGGRKTSKMFCDT